MSQPAMRMDRDDARWNPYERLGALRWLRNSWAVTRWVVLVIACGLGVAAVVAIVVALLAAAAQSI
jgi:hypothetical protein